MNRIKHFNKMINEEYYLDYGSRFCDSGPVSRIANLECLVLIRTPQHQRHTAQSTIVDSQVQLVDFRPALDY